jgi:chromosome segregation ATPase
MIEKSVSTLEEAKAKYEELVIKLQRLDSLDETLKKDIKQYKDKLTFINNEIINKFDNIDKQKEFLQKDAERMKQLLKVLETNKDNYNKLLTSLVLKNRTKNAQLEDNDTFKKLRELEKKMQVNENNIFSLQSYIDSKTDENQFGHLLKDCMELQEQINAILIKKN